MSYRVQASGGGGMLVLTGDATELMVAVAMSPFGVGVAAYYAAQALLVAFTAAMVQLRRGRHPRFSCLARRPPRRSAGGRWFATPGSRAGRGWLGAPGPRAAFGCSWQQSTRSLLRWLSPSARSSSGWPVRYGRRGANRTRSASSRPEGLPVGLSRWNSTCRPGIDETPATLGELVQACRPRRAVFLPPRCAPCQDLAGERQSANSSPTQQQHQPTPVTPDMVTRGLRRRKDNHDHQQGYGDDAD